MKHSIFALAMIGAVAARPAAMPKKREVPQEQAHKNVLDIVNESLQLNNPDEIVDAVFGLLGAEAAADGAGAIEDPDCLQQATADQAFTNAKEAGDVNGMTFALIYRALERNTGEVGLASVACETLEAVNPEIAALQQHQDPAGDGAQELNKEIAGILAQQIASIGGDPLLANEASTFEPGEIGDPTAAGNTCNEEDDAEGCINSQGLRVDDLSEDEILALVEDVDANVDANVDEEAAADEEAANADDNVDENVDENIDENADNVDENVNNVDDNSNDNSNESSSSSNSNSNMSLGGINLSGINNNDLINLLFGLQNNGVNLNALNFNGLNLNGLNINGLNNNDLIALLAGLSNDGVNFNALDFGGLNLNALNLNGLNNNDLLNLLGGLNINGLNLNGLNGLNGLGNVFGNGINLIGKQKRQGASFGECANPSIAFGAPSDGRQEDAFEPADLDSFSHGSALNINVISSFICSQLGSSCGADDAAVSLCEDAAAAADGLEGLEAADAFNQLLGF